jgi:4-hydroxy-tetrahydrodipicolinate synthase
MEYRNHPIEAPELNGTYTALITPMLEGSGLDNEIDYEKIFRLIYDQERSGVRGIVIAGTTGQSSTLSPEEHAILVEKLFNHVSYNYPNLQFIVGAGSNSTREAIDLSLNIERRIGPSSFLHVTGYYNNPPQEGIYLHFERLAKLLPNSNIILYNVPGRTSSRIEPETVIRLSHIKNIVGIKEASRDLEAVHKIISETNKERFVVLSGEDDLVFQIMHVGGLGVISASANIAPKYFTRITNASLKGDFRKALNLQEEINPLVRQGVFYRKNPIPLAHMFDSELRLPLVKLPYIELHLEEIFKNYTAEELGIDLRNYRRV